jgi:hypothetical protein
MKEMITPSINIYGNSVNNVGPTTNYEHNPQQFDSWDQT